MSVSTHETGERVRKVKYSQVIKKILGKRKQQRHGRLDWEYQVVLTPKKESDEQWLSQRDLKKL